jgi:sugar lactone lactonase YvrE
MHRIGIALTLLLAGLAACGDDGGPSSVPPDAGPPDGGLPVEAPTTVTQVVNGDDAEFESPLDAVASPDGATFYFSAYSTAMEAEALDSRATIYSVPSAGGDVSILYQGAPLREPTGLLLSCDGNTLYIADIGFTPGDEDALDEDAPAASPLYSLNLQTKALTLMTATGMAEAASLALSKDCGTIYATGYTAEGAPAVFSLPPAGGAATVIKSGPPLQSPSGVYVDADNLIWFVDQQPNEGTNAKLFATKLDGTTDEIISELRVSEPAGCSLIAAGGIAILPTRDENEAGQLLAVEIASGETTVIEAADVIEPAGIRTALNAPIMALVDADGHAIYRVE